MMIIDIKCECGNIFKGTIDKEDTCPSCLKELINPKGINKRGENAKNNE